MPTIKKKSSHADTYEQMQCKFEKTKCLVSVSVLNRRQKNHVFQCGNIIEYFQRINLGCPLYTVPSTKNVQTAWISLLHIEIMINQLLTL